MWKIENTISKIQKKKKGAEKGKKEMMAMIYPRWESTDKEVQKSGVDFFLL